MDFSMQLMSSDHFLVVLHADKKHGLIFNRLDDTVATIRHDDAVELSNLKSIGQFHGIVGRYLRKYLVLIKSKALVGTIYEPHTKTEHEIYVITQVQVIDISCISIADSASSQKPITGANSVRYDATSSKDEAYTSDSLSTFREMNSTKISGAEPSDVDNDDFSSLPITINTSSYMHSRNTQWNPFKFANSLKPRMPIQLLKSTGIDPFVSGSNGANVSSIPCSSQSTNNSQFDDSDKRLVEEMVKLFNNTNSFYFSSTLDLTNRFSRKTLVRKVGDETIWKAADERFFWNKHMLKDLIELSEENKDSNYFITVILQGFVAIEHHTVPPLTINNSGIEDSLPATSMNSILSLGESSHCDKELIDENGRIQDKRTVSRIYKLALISRRSVFHAGTRYRRRGCDEKGNCANFVETEQIFNYKQHFISVVILRGSIPLYWYQTGFNYRPPPVLFRSEDDNHKAFSKHFNNLIKAYETDQIISIDCTEQTGREKMLHDAYKRHMDRMKSSVPNIKLIEFDFHKYCRGRQCSDIQVEKHLKSCGLTEQLIKDARYYWNDGDVVWNQGSVFRVNCLDCSDRTNVVQRAIALQILDLQLARLGVIAPDTCPEDNDCRKIMQNIWSSNGNVLSTQYCGTRALFTGERKLSGYLKDTYSSASRYYISKFRDAYRQAAIDAMLGVENVNQNLHPCNLKDQGPNVDQYELINLDQLFASSRGKSALLRDVGNRVTNRLARLKGRFYVKPFELVESMRYTAGEAEDAIDENSPEMMEDGVIDSLQEMNIDWPSNESVENNDNNTNQVHQPDQRQEKNIFTQLSNCDDSFQDDEFGQLMLSIDLAELQRLRDDEFKAANSGGQGADKEKTQKPEEIHMTEATGGLKPSEGKKVDVISTISTTST